MSDAVVLGAGANAGASTASMSSDVTEPCRRLAVRRG
jgi:hypothetical protein